MKRLALLIILLSLLGSCFLRKRTDTVAVVRTQQSLPDLQSGMIRLPQFLAHHRDTGYIQLDYQYYLEAKEDWQKTTNQLIRIWYSEQFGLDSLSAQTDPKLFEEITQHWQFEANQQYHQQKQAVPWYFFSSISIHDDHPKYVELCMSKLGFKGGDQEISHYTYFHLDKESKTLMNWEAFVKDTLVFKQLAETQFRKQYQVADHESLWESGFQFPENEFKLPDNFSFDETGMTFVFNSDDPEMGMNDQSLSLHLSMEIIRNLLKMQP